MLKDITIKGERIYLKTLIEADASEKYCSGINDPKVNKYLESKAANIYEVREYIKSKYETPNCIFLGIFIKNNDEHIGNIKLELIDFTKKEATLGILIGEKSYWNKGFTTETLKLLIKYAFNNLNL